MFLIVIVTLLISILGLFMQVISLQTARLNASQNGLAQTMMTWHNAAVSQALAGVDSTPCQLTSTTAINSLPNCTRSGASVLVSSVLPTNYNTANYSFISAIFTPASPGGRYVFTYAYDTDSNTGDIYLPQSAAVAGATSTMIGYTLGDLQTQMSRSLPVNLAHGAVTASGALSVSFTNYSGTNSILSYTVPTTIPIGAIGLLSSGH